MNVCVIGAGYVGLTTAVAMAWVGHHVDVLEIDPRKGATLRGGHAPFFEPHLEQAMERCSARLRFADDPEAALAGSDVVMLAVGTPSGQAGVPDMRQVHGAVDQILAHLPKSDQRIVLAVKSTVPVGTGDEIEARIGEAGLGERLTVVSNPEFLRQGQALRDSLYPERIVLGGSSEGLAVLRQLYEPIEGQRFDPPEGVSGRSASTGVPVFEVDRRSAELAKYAANAFLAMRVSFINEIANVCDRTGADVDAVGAVIGADPRIGKQFLRAGVGYGGSCFPKDTRALHHMATTNGYDFELLSAVIRVNERQRGRVLEKLEAVLGNLEDKRVALLGLAFKPGTDDLREAPSLTVARDLVERGAQVRGHDPVAVEAARAFMPASVELSCEVDVVLEGADAAVLLTEWPQYVALPAEVFQQQMRRALIIDGRNALSEDVRRRVEYYGIGRRSPLAVVDETVSFAEGNAGTGSEP